MKELADDTGAAVGKEIVNLDKSDASKIYTDETKSDQDDFVICNEVKEIKTLHSFSDGQGKENNESFADSMNSSCITENVKGSNDVDSLKMEQMCVDDLDEDGSENESSKEMSHVQADDTLPEMTSEQRTMTLKALASKQTEWTGQVPLLSYFINVVEEPFDSFDGDLDHISKLVKDYERREGSSMKELIKESR